MRVLVASLALLLIVLCAPAGAATVSYTAGYSDPPGTAPEESCGRYGQCPPAMLVFQAAPGETNVVTVSDGGMALIFRDAGAPLSAGAGCTAQPDGTITCPRGQTAVELGDGNDSFRSNTVLFIVRGGDGNDAIAGAQTLVGGVGNDTLKGGPYSTTMLAGPGSDVVNGGDGDDVIIDDGGVEADQIDGGGGSDELGFSDRDEPVRVDLGARPQSGGSEGEGNEIADVERVSGGRGPDELLSDPAAPTNDFVVLNGAEGDDRLEVRGPGSRVLGGPGGDTIVGGAGGDSIDGGPGSDVITGGGGDDLLNGDAAPDDINGGDGKDIVLGGDGADRILGGLGDDRLSGASGRDVIRGDGGRDFLNGGGGNDQLFGGAGRDRLLGDTGADFLSGDADADRLEGGAHGDRLLGLGGADRIIGGSGADRVSGGAGGDVISVADRWRDRVACGPGRDRVTVDRRDRSTGCERVRRR